MDIAQLIQTLIGTIVGGGIVIAANWISVQEQRRKDAQEWYEQTYVTNGIDPLLIYLQSLKLYILKGWGVSFIQLAKLDPMPIEALTKIQILLDDSSLTSIIVMLPASFNDETGYIRNAADNAITDTHHVLLNMRHELLIAIAKKVRNKNYQIDLQHRSKELDKIFRGLMKKIDEITKDEDEEG